MTTEQLQAAYETMLRIRICEEMLGDCVSAGEVGTPCHLYIGEEGIAAGVCAALRRDDFIWGAHRSHGHYLAKTGDLSGMVNEVFCKASGCAHGRGGSMHLCAPEAGIMGTVPIVAGTIPLAVGAGLAAKARGDGGVSVSFFGDGATEEGHFHESLNLAALYELPVVFACENNLYASHLHLLERRTKDAITSFAEPYGMPASQVDGNDVEAVFAATAEATERARDGGGPSLLEFRTYRWRGHVGPAADMDVGVKRRSELDEWLPRCPISRTRARLLESGTDEGRLAEVEESVRAEVTAAIEQARSEPKPSPSTLVDNVYTTVASTEAPDQPAPSAPRSLSYVDAICEAHHQLLASDKDVCVIGQGLWSPWYVGASMKDLDTRFGRDRVLDTPVSENAVTGSAIGAALAGLKPIVVHPRMDFMLLAMDPIINQASNWSYMFDGAIGVPMVIRPIINRGGEQGAQHSQALQALLAHMPGLKVVMPATAYDAKGLLAAAMYDGNPVVYIDDRWLYEVTDDVPQELYSVPIGKGAIRRAGDDVTIVASSFMVKLALEAAAELAGQGVSAEVIDLRSIKPWDAPLVCESVGKTGRLVVADGGWGAFGVSAEIVATVASRAFDALKSAPVRVTLPDAPAPTSSELEAAYYPTEVTILAAVEMALGTRSRTESGASTELPGQIIG